MVASDWAIHPGVFFRIQLPREFFRIDFRYPDEPETGGPILEE